MTSVCGSAGIGLGVATMLAGAWLPFVPAWRPMAGRFLVAGLALALLSISAVALTHCRATKQRRRRVRIVAAAALAGLLLLISGIGLAWGAFDITGLESEDLVTTVTSADRGQHVFIYHRSRIPDGIVTSRIAVQRSRLPLERTLLEVPGPVLEAYRADSTVVIVFLHSGAVRYDFRSGRVDRAASQPIPAPR